MSTLLESQGDAVSVLSNRNFLLLWLAQAVSQTAQNAIFYVLVVFIEERTASTLHTGVLILSTIIPSVLFGLAAGVFVDRWRKKTVLVVTNILRGLAILVYIFLGHTLALIYVVNLGFSTISQFFAPAEVASIPLLVSKKKLLSANGLFNLTFTSSQLAGFVIVGPILIKWFNPEPIFVILALAFTVAALLVSFLPSKEPWVERRRVASSALLFGIGEEIREAWRLLHSDRTISLSILYLTLMAALILIVGMLAPGYANRVLKVGTDNAIYIFAPAGIGVLLGIILLPHVAPRYGKKRILSLGLFVMALSLFVMGLLGRGEHYVSTLVSGITNGSLSYGAAMIGLAMMFTFLLGLAYASINAPSQTIIQERAPAEMRGRIFATQLVFGNLAAVLPLLFIGGLADLFGINLVFCLIAVVVAFIGGLSLRQSQQLASSEEVPPFSTGP